MATRDPAAMHAACRRADHRLAAHDPDRRRRTARRAGALGVLQHLLHPGPRRRGDRGRPGRHRPRPRPASRSTPGRARPWRSTGGAPSRCCCGRTGAAAMILDDGGDATLLVHKGAEFESRRARSRPPTPRSTRSSSTCCTARSARTPALDRIAAGIKGVTEETTTGVHRLYEMHRAGTALPGDQRQRLGDQEQVRQQVRLPPLAHRRHQPRHRRADRRQEAVALATATWARAVRRVAARPGRPGRGDRGRPDLRAAGGDGRLPGRRPTTWSARQIISHRDRLRRRREHCADDARGHVALGHSTRDRPGRAAGCDGGYQVDHRRRRRSTAAHLASPAPAASRSSLPTMAHAATRRPSALVHLRHSRSTGRLGALGVSGHTSRRSPSRRLTRTKSTSTSRSTGPRFELAPAASSRALSDAVSDAARLFSPNEGRPAWAGHRVQSIEIMPADQSTTVAGAPQA